MQKSTKSRNPLSQIKISSIHDEAQTFRNKSNTKFKDKNQMRIKQTKKSAN